MCEWDKQLPEFKLWESLLCIHLNSVCYVKTLSSARHPLLKQYLEIEHPRATYLDKEMNHQRRHALLCSLGWQITGEARRKSGKLSACG